MKEVIVKETFTVPSQYLGPHVLINFLTRMIKDEKINTCSRQHGYICKVMGLEKIHEGHVSLGDATNRLTVSYRVQAIRPEIDDVYEAVVTGNYSQGVFLKVLDLFQVLLPGVSASSGSSIKVKMAHVEYKNKAFWCIGEKN